MSSTTHSTCACDICNETGHHPSKCPTLNIPPFTFGSGTGGGVHQPDDEEGDTLQTLQTLQTLFTQLISKHPIPL